MTGSNNRKHTIIAPPEDLYSMMDDTQRAISEAQTLHSHVRMLREDTEALLAIDDGISGLPSRISYSLGQSPPPSELKLDVDAVRQARYSLCTKVVSLRSRLRHCSDDMILDPLRRSMGDLQAILQDVRQEISRVEVALWRLQLRSEGEEYPVTTASRQSIQPEPVGWL